MCVNKIALRSTMCVDYWVYDVYRFVIYGMQNGEEKRESILKPKECARCQLSNQATNRFCSRCGLPLDEEAKTEVMRKDMERKEADQLLDRLLNDGEFREMFVRKINQTKPMQ